MIYKLIELFFKVFGLFGSECETTPTNNSVILVSSSDSFTRKPKSQFTVNRFYRENGIF